VTAAAKVAVVVLLLRMLRRAGMFELNCDAALLIASEGPDDWLLRNSGDDTEQKQQNRLCVHDALVEGTTVNNDQQRQKATN